MPFLEIHDADGVNKMSLDGDALVIGRLETCDLVIDARGCSKQHCRLEKRGRVWRAIDLASANGTMVNGAEISQVILQDGDAIDVGGATLVFRRGSATAVPREPAQSAAGESKREAKSKIPMIVGVLAVVVVARFLIGGSDDDQAAKPDESGAEVASDDPKDAEKAFDEASVDTTLTSFNEMKARTDLPFDEKDSELAFLALQAKTAELQSEINAYRKSSRARFEAGFRTQLNVVAQDAKVLTDQGRFGAALDGLTAFVTEAEAMGARRIATDARKKRLDVMKAARQSWDDLRAKVATLNGESRFDEARTAVQSRLDDFRGTRFEALARSEMQLVDMAAAKVRQTAAKVVADTGAKEAESLIGQAEKLAASRTWTDAGKLYTDAMALVKDEDLLRRWRERRDVLDALGRIKDEVVAAANDQRKVVRTVRIGKIKAKLARADADAVELTFARTGQVIWQWKEIPPEQLVDLFAFAARRGADVRMAFAIACHEYGQVDRACEELAKVADEQSLKVPADRLYAAWRGIEVPATGFIIEDGAFYTPAEYERVELVRRARKLSATLARATPEKFREAAHELKAMGDVAHAPFQAALRERHAAVTKRFEQLAVVKRVGTVRQQIKGMLDERRAEAFKLIFDKVRYPYPYGPNQAEVQGEVNALVAKVREVYEKPSRELLESSKGLAALDAEVREVISFMAPLGDSPVPSSDALLLRLDKLLDMRTYGLGKTERKHSEEALVFNAEIKSSITDAERELHGLTNEYRMLMGLQAVKIDEALVRAARGHSQEMKDLGYFAHDSPTPERKTPSMRAQLAGWGGGCSENIARGQGTPAGALHGWINSSGHHRNVLGRRHTHLGCGKAKDGAFWTQNFATGASSSLSQEKIDPDEQQKGKAQVKSKPSR